MYGRTSDPRQYPPTEEPTWKGILISYAMIVAVPFILWVVSQPLVGTAVLAGIVSLAIGLRRGYRLAHCFSHCERIVIDLGEAARITITHPPIDDAT